MRKFQEVDSVLTRDYRESTEKSINGLIVHQLGPVTYQVKVGDMIWKRHIYQLQDRKPTVSVDNQYSFDGGDVNLPLIVSLPPLSAVEHQQESSPATSLGTSPKTVVKTPVRAELAHLRV